MFSLPSDASNDSTEARLVEALMSEKELFEGLPEAAPAAVERGGGRPRMREPERRQVELRAVDFDSLLSMDHAARVIWRYVEALDLGVLEEAIEAREHTPGQAPASPRLLLALWLYATSQGVGSARALERLCTSHDAYRWLCGGVSVNYHGLADFRSGHGELLDQLLTHNIATLSAAGVIELAEVVQDGVRVRASAGAASFHRGKSLHKHLKKARRLVEHLKREVDEDPDASNRRIKAATERAAREREQRVAAALGKLAEIEAERERRAKTNKKQVAKQRQPRVSTTDPQARVMKMPDGGFRPAYNCQIGTVAEGQIVVDVAVDTTARIAACCDPCSSGCASATGVCRGVNWSTAASTRTTIPSGRPARASSSTDRPPRASTTAIPMPPDPKMGPAWPPGGGA
jgi:transposase